MENHDSITYSDFLFTEDLSELDPDTDRIIAFEEERQANKIILIPSESICPKAVRQALSCVFTNLYAEGYPSLRMTKHEREYLLDFKHQFAYHWRYSDRRYYKGCEFVDFIEALAQRRAAELFATEQIPPEQIFVNVQPLSGAAANNAVYEAFLQPGDTVMGMSLIEGGHLTHGSEANRSGKYYRIVSYLTDRTGKLNYDEIKKLAIEHQPKMIIAGYSAYPWSVDWHKFREVADSVGAILMADIAHPAGLVIAGKYPSPVGIADVTTLTTHKTLCGPRGAIIITTDEENAKKVDRAVFPGEQGGPHINNIAAKAVAFKIAQTEKFRRLQEKIAENAKLLATSLEKRGLKLAYGGTDSHLLLIDLKSIKSATERPLKGEIASRILDICGITCNKNAIAGDEDVLDPSGIRLGTPWITQRGFGEKEIDKLAELIHKVLTNIQPYSYMRMNGEVGRGKIDLKIIEEVKSEATELARSVSRENHGRTSIPSDCRLSIVDCRLRNLFNHQSSIINHQSSIQVSPLLASHRKLNANLKRRYGLLMPAYYSGSNEEETVNTELQTAKTSAALIDLSDSGLLEIIGERAQAFLQDVTTNNVMNLKSPHTNPPSPPLQRGMPFPKGGKIGECQRSFLLDENGKLIDDVLVARLPMDERGREHYLMVTNPANTEKVRKWLYALSDGYVIFDKDDLFAKVDGPIVVDDLTGKFFARIALHGPKSSEVLKAIGIDPDVLQAHPFNDAHIFRTGYPSPLSPPSFPPHAGGRKGGRGDERGGMRFEIYISAQYAAEIWESLLKAGAKPAGFLVEEKLRAEANLPSYSDAESPIDAVYLYNNGFESLFDVSKPYFIGQKFILIPPTQIPPPPLYKGGCPLRKGGNGCPTSVGKKEEFHFSTDEDTPLKHSCLYDEHLKLTSKTNMVPFAGWSMPVSYGRISEEHSAVREAAGLFDVSHMGVLEISGEGATRFLDLVTTNYVSRLRIGQCHYSYILAPDGLPMDDVMVYRRESERYMMVVNAVNTEKIKAWLHAVNSKKVIIDTEHPSREVDATPIIRNLKDKSVGIEQKVDVALQGPNSLAILQKLIDSANPPLIPPQAGGCREKLSKLKRFEFIETELRGIKLIISKTGYTGEDIGFELYLHPDEAPKLWNLLLEEGKEFGVKPAGLGARDSTRTEAGLPLYGHELAGEHNITPIEAGYGAFVKLHKPFFIGRKACLEKETKSPLPPFTKGGKGGICIIRFQMNSRGIRMVRPGSPVVNKRGEYIGVVTSCALGSSGFQVGMAYVSSKHSEAGTQIGIFTLPRGKAEPEKLKDQLEMGDKVLLHDEATILTRFMMPEIPTANLKTDEDFD
ncbi:glycine cleavage system aminomethyltransferase GcvT [Candidatus Poribacteria bacterium]|nr:glycine cleavage system aminomethyltransferase GcvT [Candidatus Poribacteria bacterium]